MKNPAGKSHAELLRDLGFPEKAIAEAVRTEANGLFGLKPLSDLADRVLARAPGKIG